MGSLWCQRAALRPHNARAVHFISLRSLPVLTLSACVSKLSLSTGCVCKWVISSRMTACNGSPLPLAFWDRRTAALSYIKLHGYLDNYISAVPALVSTRNVFNKFCGIFCTVLTKTHNIIVYFIMINPITNSDIIALKNLCLLLFCDCGFTIAVFFLFTSCDITMQTRLPGGGMQIVISRGTMLYFP